MPSAHCNVAFARCNMLNNSCTGRVGGWPTGNGNKVSNSQACCLTQLCLAAAHFLSISCVPSTPSALYIWHFWIKSHLCWKDSHTDSWDVVGRILLNLPLRIHRGRILEIKIETYVSLLHKLLPRIEEHTLLAQKMLSKSAWSKPRLMQPFNLPPPPPPPPQPPWPQPEFVQGQSVPLLFKIL